MINRIDTIIKFKYTKCSLIPIVQNKPPRAGPDMVDEMMIEMMIEITIEMMIEMKMMVVEMMIEMTIEIKMMVIEMMIEMTIEMKMTIITMVIYDNHNEDYTVTNIKNMIKFYIIEQ